MLLLPHRSIAGALLLTAAAAQDAPTLDHYLPDGVRYDPAFQKPADVLGWEVGTWHARHDQIVRWFEVVAQASPRVSLERYGETHEQRPLLLATVTSEENHARLEELRAAHREAALSGAEDYQGPAVVWMGNGVHGDEPSGSNASMLLLYHLAAAQGDEIEAFLASTIVLIDPCINPDGTARFAQWANQHRGRNAIGDPLHREHTQAWPGGRTNHYWFDLNRDWLLLTHPESRARVARFHDWMPHVLTDYHEMGASSTYFFQPGIPSRRNPFTPEENVRLTERIAAQHAEALDAIGSLYYTEESFDDFYYGKGSTYPDIHGAVGILFEQASSRGHAHENDHGGLTFPFTIRNQFVTSLSTLRAVDAMRDDLSAYQRRFYREARAEARELEVQAYVFGHDDDPARAFRMADLLRRHDIAVHHLTADLELDGVTHPADRSYIVPLDQPQSRLVRALFETRTSWDDNTFYDVSSWTLPLSFGLATTEVRAEATAAIGERFEASAPAAGSVHAWERPSAWAFRWGHANGPRALAKLLGAGVRARVATRPFAALNEDPNVFLEFDRGTIVVPTGIQEVPATELRALVEEVANLGLDVYAIQSGLTKEGIDLGSNNLRPLEAPELLLLVGRGASNYEAGEVWHELDVRVDLPVTLAERRSFGSMDLSRYTHIVLVSGAVAGWSEDDEARLRDWVRAGGVLIAQKSSAVWVAEHLLTNAEDEGEHDHDAHPAPPADDRSGEETTEAGAATSEQDGPPSYDDYQKLRAETRVSGTIFRTRLDRTHPLAFGFEREHLAVFRNSTSVLPESADPFAVPVRYTDAPLLSGYASDENVARFAGSPAVRAHRLGAGTVVAMIDDPNFRGVWDGTARLFTNAVFFGGAIQRTGPLDSEEEAGAVEVEDQHGHH